MDNAKEAALLLQSELAISVDISETLAQRGFDTAERVKARKPEVWRACKKLLGLGVGLKQIEDILGLDIRIVLAIQKDGEADGSIPPYKERTVALLRSIITLGLDALLTKARDGKISPIELCALIDKAELLSGGVTQRTEIKEDQATVEFRRFLQSVPARMVSPGGEILENPALPAGGAAPGPAAVGEGSTAVVEAEVLERTGDLQSFGFES